ncbi:MAG: HTH domain-containing protein [Phycisphaerales bacterium]
MAKRATKKTAPKPATRAKAAKTPSTAPDAAGAGTAARAAKGATRLSALDAAAQALADAPAEGMGAKGLIAEMKARGLWESKAGKTPEATLYAAIIREIGRKGERARFRKVARGRFVLAT